MDDETAVTAVWCAASLARDDDGAVTGRRVWCALTRMVYGRRPEYRDSEPTRCGHHIVWPCGYELRAPTCEDCR